MGGKRIAVVACCLFGLLGSRKALADGSADQVDEPDREIGPSYLWDGGAIPFLWAPRAGRILLDVYTTPRSTPLAFDSFEGGATKADWQIPGWAITGLGGVTALGMIAGGDDARYYHVKGLAESLATGVLVTGAIKVVVGRHRPDWDADSNTPGSRRSFPSGHATQAFAIATYGILYLRGHVFDKLRGNSRLPWWEAATYGGIALGATALAGERVLHNRHHLSDVAIGGLLGTASSTLFYLYQEKRYDNHASREMKQLTVTPTQGSRGATVGISFAW
jgi:membrane-associated phospholipid phosphatase